jgi:hypothetical protein
MIAEFLQAAHRMDASIVRVLGRPYHAVLGIGLGAEVVERFRQLEKTAGSDMGLVHLALVMLLYLALLIHQVGELHAHMKEKREREAAYNSGGTRE